MSFVASLMGMADPALLERGRPGRALILDVSPTGATLDSDEGVAEAICLFILEVRSPAIAAYHATTRQRFPVSRLDEIEPGQTLVAVRIDVSSPSRVAIDWDAPVVVTAA